LMKKLGKRQMTLQLQDPMAAIPEALSAWPLTLKPGGHELEMTFEAGGGNGTADIPSLLRRMGELGIAFKDLSTHQSSLEDIFVSLVGDRARVTS